VTSNKHDGFFFFLFFLFTLVVGLAIQHLGQSADEVPASNCCSRRDPRSSRNFTAAWSREGRAQFCVAQDGNQGHRYSDAGGPRKWNNTCMRVRHKESENENENDINLLADIHVSLSSIQRVKVTN
jgi:hypothetical protein